MRIRRLIWMPTLALAWLLAAAPPAPAAATDAAGDGVAVPRIFLDRPERIVEYQLGRLSNEQLIRVERQPEPKYRPVYRALLTRAGLERQHREEAIDTLAEIDEDSPLAILLDALAEVDEDEDPATARELLAMLLAQDSAALRGERPLLSATIAEVNDPLVLRGAYRAMLVADGRPEPAWQLADSKGHLPILLAAVAHLPDDAVRERLFAPIAALLESTDGAVETEAALAALGWTAGHEAEAFAMLASHVRGGGLSEGARAAAVSALRRIPSDHWPADEADPLARAIVDLIENADADRRTDADMIEAIQLGEDLATALPAERASEVRAALRGLVVRTVLVEAVHEQMAFDLRWFVVEAGEPVQIVLHNPDAMPHNLVVAEPGALQEVGIAAASMPPPSDSDDRKPYVPDLSSVLHATGMLGTDETERLTFDAPAEPGEYLYICTYPGHFVRMYGVMLVVEDIDAYERDPFTPADPMTGQPFPSRHFDPQHADPPPAEGQHEHP